jgi:O-antigen/teichoic acid export membrane protein
VLNVILLARRIQTFLPGLRFQLPDISTFKALVSFSAYAYLSRIAAVAYQNTDKILIGGMIDMRAVAFYTVPFLLANRLYGMCFRFAQVLFPISSALAAENKLTKLRETYLQASRYLVFINGCVCVLLVLLSRELLHYWAGEAFNERAALTLILIAFACFVDTLTYLPSLVNDGLGRPRITGGFAVLRASLGISLAYLAIRDYGFLGAAYAQLIASCVTATVFVCYIHRVSIPVPLKEVFVEAFRPTFGLVAITIVVAVWAVNRPVLGLFHFSVLAVAATSLLLGFGWLVILTPTHRLFLINRFRANYF